MFYFGRVGLLSLDKHLTENSGILDHLTPGDVILADKGFDIQESRIHQGEKAVGWH